MTIVRMARTRKNRRRWRRGGCCQSTISGMSLACFQERFRLKTKQAQLYAVCSRDQRLAVPAKESPPTAQTKEHPTPVDAKGQTAQRSGVTWADISQAESSRQRQSYA